MSTDSITIGFAQEKQRHYEAIARELFAIDRRQPAHGIVLADTGAGRRGPSRPFCTPIWSRGSLGQHASTPKPVTPCGGSRHYSRGAGSAPASSSERALVRQMMEGVGEWLGESMGLPPP